MIVFLIIVAVVMFFFLWQAFHAKRMTKNTVLCFTGGLGTGKTYCAVQKAVGFYRRQRLRYRLRWIPIVGSKHPPHIYSNIPIKLGRNKYSEVLSLEHIIMTERLPEKSIVLIDEIGQFANQYEYDNPYVMAYLQEFIRFFRHYIDGRLVLTDQASDNIVKPIRLRINIIYNLNDFHRMWLFLPFFKVSVDELACVEDSVQNVNIMDQERKDEYFFGFLPYRWMKSKKYDSRCYSIMYMAKKLFTAPARWRKDLKTNYLINIDASEEARKDWKKYRKIAPLCHMGDTKESDTTNVSRKP